MRQEGEDFAELLKILEGDQFVQRGRKIAAGRHSVELPEGPTGFDALQFAYFIIILDRLHSKYSKIWLGFTFFFSKEKKFIAVWIFRIINTISDC